MQFAGGVLVLGFVRMPSARENLGMVVQERAREMPRVLGRPEGGGEGQRE